MERHAFALKIKQGKYNEFRSGLGVIWDELTQILDEMKVTNFSLWNIEEIVFGYYERDLKVPEVKDSDWEKLDKLLINMNDTFEWISSPKSEMRLMYEDYGFVRMNKEQIRHRVFVTRLRGDYQEEYKARHDALANARTCINPGPDSNFTIWNSGRYIFGYDEIDVTMETEETEESRQNTIAWETKMLEIMEWYTDDVDWITGEHHKHIVRIGYHN